MPEILTFVKIKNGNIFEDEFENLIPTGNACIEFKMQNHANGGISVIYAPNGAGKTSLCRTLSIEEDTEEINFQCHYNGINIQGSDKKFHVINDQISRNIIPGDTSDYLIGADIRREYELKKSISQGFKLIFSNIPKTFKEKYKVTKVGDFLLNRIANIPAVKYQKS